MTYDPRQGGHDCPPPPVDPAPQPRPPGKECDAIPPTTAPVPDDPPKCPEDPNCKCEDGPTSTQNCLESLINDKAGELAALEKTKAFKTDLEALLAKAKAAAQDYTKDKFDKLVKEWVKQDKEIAELIRKLVCAVPCWYCVIECYVCPLLNAMRDAELRLYWDPKNYPKAYNLYDVLEWRTRDKEAKERRFGRIKSVLTAWEKPAQTIEKNLADNAKLIADANKALGSDATKLVFDVFLKLVPLHLAIAPPVDPKSPSTAKWTTVIDKQFTKFCGCDTGTPDDCCGPDAGEWSLRQRLVGPQPYLIDPNTYIDLICCLVKHRYATAQKALGEAESELLKAENLIKHYKAVIDDGLKNFDKNGKGAIPSVIDCCDFDPKKKDPAPSDAR